MPIKLILKTKNKKQRDKDLEQFERLYQISGDGVAHLDVEKALKSPRFKKSLSDLLDADLTFRPS